jgi:hypothetical protein
MVARFFKVKVVPCLLLAGVLCTGCGKEGPKPGATSYTPTISKPATVPGKPPPTVPKPADTPAQVTLSAQAFYDAFTRNLTDAQQKYGGKVIELTGTIGVVTKNGNGQPEIYLSAGGDAHGVRCIFFTEEDYTEKVSRGQLVKIRGWWPVQAQGGYLADCVLAGQ